MASRVITDAKHLKLRRQKYLSPKKGTKRRKMINMLLRPQGATGREIYLATGMNSNTARDDIVNGWVQNDGGFIISTSRERRQMSIVYRITGRYRMNGSYRSWV